MIKYLRIFSVWLAVIAVLLSSVITCICYDVVCGSAKVPSQVATGESFIVNLQAQCNSDIGVIMFTLVHGSEIKYKSCRVNDGSCGYIENTYSDNTLSVIYINTKGISTKNTTELIEVTFQAEETVTSTDIQIYTSYGASADENALVSDNGEKYSIDIVEKVVNKQPANGTKLKSSSVLSDKGSSSVKEKKIPTEKIKALETIATEKATTVNNTVSVSRPSDRNLFFSGIIFAVAVVISIAVSYKTGKKNGCKNK